MSISNDEYTMLVEQLTAVKMEKYELIEKNKKMVKDSTADKNRILELESQNAHYFKERQRADELLAASKDAQQVSELKHENENQREQIKLLKQSMQQLFEGQQKAQSELEYLRKVQSKVTDAVPNGDPLIAPASDADNSTISSLKQSIAERDVKIDDLTAKCVAVERNLADAQADIDRLHSSKQSEAERLKTLQADLDRVLTKLSQREQEAVIQGDEVAGKMRELSATRQKVEQLEKIAQTADELQKQLSEAQQELGNKEKAIAALKVRCDGNEEMVRLSTEAAKDANKLKHENEVMTKERNEHQAQLRLRENQTQIAKDECEALRLSLSETQASSSTWEKEFRQADSRRQELAQRLSQTELNLTAMREALENACAEKDVALRSADEQLDQARARSAELQKALADARSQLSHADDLVMALKKEGDKIEQQHQQQLRSLQDELQNAKLSFESRFTELQSTSQAEIEDLNNQLLSTKADLEEAQAQQRIIDAKRSQLVKELRRQLKQELLLNREMQVTIRSMQDELGEARAGAIMSQKPSVSGSRIDSAAFSVSASLLHGDSVPEPVTPLSSPTPNTAGMAAARRQASYSSAQLLQSAATPFTSPVQPTSNSQNGQFAPSGSGVGDEVAAAMMQKLADAQEQNFSLRQKMKVVEENARRERAECEAQKQIVASLINRFGGSSNSFSGRLPQLNSLSDAERADLYKKMDMLLEELSLHNVQLKATIDHLGGELQNMQTELTEAHEAIESLQDEIESNQTAQENVDVEALEQEKADALAALRNELNEMLRNRENELSESHAKIGLLENQIAESSALIAELRTESDASQSKIVELNETISQSQSKLEEVSAELNESKSEIQKLKEQAEQSAIVASVDVPNVVPDVSAEVVVAESSAQASELETKSIVADDSALAIEAPPVEIEASVQEVPSVQSNSVAESESADPPSAAQPEVTSQAETPSSNVAPAEPIAVASKTEVSSGSSNSSKKKKGKK